jgi:excisionase family DNA binding protein
LESHGNPSPHYWNSRASTTKFDPVVRTDYTAYQWKGAIEVNATHAFETMVKEIEERVYQRIMREIGSTQPVDKRLSIAEAAEYLGVEPSTVQRLCAAKVLPCIRMGVPGSKRPRVLMSQRSLDMWMRQQESS